MIDLTPILEAIIALAVAIVTVFVLPWIKSKTTAQEREEMLAWVDIAVAAAQQLFYANSGKTRLTYALSILANKGYNINDDTVCDAVEAAVLKLHQEMRKDTLEDLTLPEWAREGADINDSNC